MGDLEDLNTSEIGLIGYYNVLDHGASYLDPGDLVFSDRIRTWEAYDNGIEGTISHPFGGGADWTVYDFDFRAKADGWIVVYTDRDTQEHIETGTVGYDGNGMPNAPMNLFHDYPDYSSQADPENTSFGQIIEHLIEEMGNSGDVNFSEEDVGIYNYREPGSEYITLLTHRFYSGDDVSSTFMYGDDVDILEHWCYATGRHRSQYSTGSHYHEFNGEVLGDISVNTDGTSYSTYVTSMDVKKRGLADGSNTTYENYTQHDYSYSEYTSKFSHLIFHRLV